MSAKPKTELDGPSVASVHNTNVSLRDYVAGQALAGMLASGEWSDAASPWVAVSYHSPEASIPARACPAR